MARLRFLAPTIALSTALLLAGCETAPQHVAPPPPPPAVAPPAPAPVVLDWRDQPLTPGRWFYAKDEQGSTARYGLTSPTAVFEMKCNRAAREVRLMLPGVGGGALDLQTSYGVRPTFFRANVPTDIYTTFPANDRILDEIAFTRGRFSLAVSGKALVMMPAWAEPARVIEDCRG